MESHVGRGTATDPDDDPATAPERLAVGGELRRSKRGGVRGHICTAARGRRAEGGAAVSTPAGLPTV